MHNSIISISWWQVVRLKAAEEPFVGPFLLNNTYCVTIPVIVFSSVSAQCLLYTDNITLTVCSQSLQSGCLSLRVSSVWSAQTCTSSALPVGFLSRRLHGGWTVDLCRVSPTAVSLKAHFTSLYCELLVIARHVEPHRKAKGWCCFVQCYNVEHEEEVSRSGKVLQGWWMWT